MNTELEAELTRFNNDEEKIINNFVNKCEVHGNCVKHKLFPDICHTPEVILEKFPMSEKEILSSNYDEWVKETAIDFLKSEDKGIIAATMYMCIYAKSHGLSNI